ncbi:ExbD/TolR family protein [Aquitalea pelogenes]|uniref:ExbD/TolR family protein n=1 Tax=Aquitalea pelogenes TaxID=1293573 RepID=UPI000B295E45|nr:biopolymer transporter ExbD [Aquitalea pelogenes]
MAFGSFDKGPGAPMAEINTTPLVDVMLVLLVVFIITAPLLTNSVKLDLPQAAAAAHQDKPEQIRLSINAAGALFWNDQPVSQSALAARFAAAVQSNPKVELNLRADKSVRYELVATTLATPSKTASAASAF